MFTRLICIAAAVAVLATGAQAQQSKGVKTFPQTKPFVPVKPIYKVPVYQPPVYKLPVYTPPVFYPPVFFKPFPVYKSPYWSPYQSPFGPKFPWYGW
jgi:hypothetical protein